MRWLIDSMAQRSDIWNATAKKRPYLQQHLRLRMTTNKSPYALKRACVARVLIHVVYSVFDFRRADLWTCLACGSVVHMSLKQTNSKTNIFSKTHIPPKWRCVESSGFWKKARFIIPECCFSASFDEVKIELPMMTSTLFPLAHGSEWNSEWNSEEEGRCCC